MRFLILLLLPVLLISCTKVETVYIHDTSNYELLLPEMRFITIYKYADKYSIPTEFVPPMKDYEVSDKFGFRISPVTEGPVGQFNIHKGMDLVGPKGSEIIAVKDGVIIEHFPPPGTKGKRGIIFSGHPIYGGCIMIDHGMGMYTLYAHMKYTYVWRGMKVKAGNVIGVQGHTGDATGDHLHFEILIDPYYALKEAQDKRSDNGN